MGVVAWGSRFSGMKKSTGTASRIQFDGGQDRGSGSLAGRFQVEKVPAGGVGSVWVSLSVDGTAWAAWIIGRS